MFFATNCVKIANCLQMNAFAALFSLFRTNQRDHRIKPNLQIMVTMRLIMRQSQVEDFASISCKDAALTEITVNILTAVLQPTRLQPQSQQAVAPKKTLEKFASFFFRAIANLERLADLRTAALEQNNLTHQENPEEQTTVLTRIPKITMIS